MFDLILNPSQLFARLVARPRWLTPFLVVVLLTVSATCLTAPLSRQLVMQHLPAGMDQGRLERLESSFTLFTYLGIAFTPVVVFVRIGIVTVLLYAIMVLAGIEAPYRQVLSLLSWASIVTGADRLGGAIMNYVSGAERIIADSDLQTTFLSANAFFDTANPLLRGLFDSLSPLSIWSFALLTLGISIIGRVPRMRALLVTGTVWCMQTGFLMLVAVLSWRSRIS